MSGGSGFVVQDDLDPLYMYDSFVSDISRKDGCALVIIHAIVIDRCRTASGEPADDLAVATIIKLLFLTLSTSRKVWLRTL